MIHVNGLTKRYGSTPVVNDVSFTCEPGTVTGFLGPNGAGKSTTLRMLVGLARPDAGAATVAGHAFAQLPNPTRVAGVLLDASALHAGRTGRETLRIAAAMAGVPSRRIGGVLSAVGLTAAADKRIGTYSLGMRQRLGIGQALVGDPDILILDEPANGLDPEGIVWIRGLLRDFAERGGTVLLSSHLLGEVQATVDHLVVIRSGRVVARGAVSDLLAASGLVARATDPRALRRLLHESSVPFTDGPDGGVRVEVATGVDAEYLAALAVRAGVPLVELRTAENDLEGLFFSLTGADADDSVAGRAGELVHTSEVAR